MRTVKLVLTAKDDISRSQNLTFYDPEPEEGTHAPFYKILFSNKFFKLKMKWIVFNVIYDTNIVTNHLQWNFWQKVLSKIYENCKISFVKWIV